MFEKGRDFQWFVLSVKAYSCFDGIIGGVYGENLRLHVFLLDTLLFPPKGVFYDGLSKHLLPQSETFRGHYNTWVWYDNSLNENDDSRQEAAIY